MPDHDRSVLLTGFGPFPGVTYNVSGVFVRQLAQAARLKWPLMTFHSAILPTQWDDGPRQATDLLRARRPELVLHFGVSSKAKGFQIELNARNHSCELEDAVDKVAGVVSVRSDGPAVLPVTLASEAIVARLVSSGFPAELSDDAGAYICNAVLYHSLSTAREMKSAMRVGFIHIPDHFRPNHARLTAGSIQSAAVPGERMRAPERVPCPAASGVLTVADAVAGGLEILTTCFLQMDDVPSPST